MIANGRTPGVLDMICAGKPVGTLFLASSASMRRAAGRYGSRGKFVKAAVSENVRRLAEAAKEAARAIASASDDAAQSALEAVAQALEQRSAAILAANAADVRDAQAAVQRGELSRVLVDRLKLSPAKLDVDDCRRARRGAACPIPIGRVLDRTSSTPGLNSKK